MNAGGEENVDFYSTINAYEGLVSSKLSVTYACVWETQFDLIHFQIS